MSHFKYLLTFVIVLYAGLLCAQTYGNRSAEAFSEGRSYKSNGLSLLAAWHYHTYHFGEIGFLHTFNPLAIKQKELNHFLIVSSEMGVAAPFTLGPKISYALSSGYNQGVTIRVNTIYYTDFSNNSYVARPEAGFKLKKYFHLLYGYSFSLLKKDMNNINLPHNLSLVILISKKATYYWE